MARLTPAEVLDQPKRDAVENQAPVVKHGEFYLAGGTALALQLGHRRSRDLDWFTHHHFDAERLTKVLQSLPRPPTSIEPPRPDTARVFYGELETSFIRYAGVRARPLTVEVQGVKLPIADLETVAAMKAGAVIGRGESRDFIDIHALVRSPGWSMERFVDVAITRARISPGQLRLGLTYFRDAETRPVRDCTAREWETIKRDLFRDVTRAFDRLHERGRNGRGDGGLER